MNSPCVLTPPASAYWSYWHAGPGADDWEYSQLGAMLYEPRPGSVDLWVFGGTDIGGTKGRPTVTPDQLRAHNTRPTGGERPPDPAATREADPPPPGTDTGPAPGRAPATTPAAPPTAARPPAPTPPYTAPPDAPAPASPTDGTSTSAPAPAGTGTTAPATPPASATPPPDDSRIVDASPRADGRHDTGSVLPVVATAGLVLAIAGAGWAAARRRRRAD
ncbi:MULTISPECIES: hypothetical protein [Streptomyces]|uniref:hypothetical protein n=1 Tax=Streptomyces TaxID=1883 RepID=UPI002B057CA6|nr:hypothetical protein [Streptomyces sp. JHD 1]